MSGDSPEAGRAATVTVMATPPKRLPLTADEIAEGEQIGRQWRYAAAARDAWLVRMDRKYRDQYHHLPSHLARIVGTSRWTYQRAVRVAEEGEQHEGQPA